MRPCTSSGCPYWTLTDPQHCEYHAKEQAGLFDGRATERRSRDSVPPSAVLSEEQLELARLLGSLGASETEVRRALSRRA